MVAPLIAAEARAVAGAVGRGKAVKTGAAEAGARVETQTTQRRRTAQEVRERMQARASGKTQQTVTGRKPEFRVGTMAAVLMVFTALLTDIIQFFITFIPLLGQVINFFAAVLSLCIFGLWFYLLGVDYFSGRKGAVKMLAAFSGVVVELVPLVSALPALTISVIAVIWASRLEDRTNPRLKLPSAAPRFSPQRIGSRTPTPEG